MPIQPLQPPHPPVLSAPGVAAGLRATAATPDPAAHHVAPGRPDVDTAPSADALAAVQVAAQAYELLRRSGRELRFAADDGVMRIEVYDGDGQLVRTIPPNEALALASQEASWRA